MRLFSDVSERIADPWLCHACELAERGRGTTAPNPVVGCVIVKDGQAVGEGHHERAGGPHAEVVALEGASHQARRATAYVTLEPCNHEGRTPPCTRALIGAGVARVVIGMADPNPGVAGGGADALRHAGIEVEFADDPGPFQDQLEPWVHFVRTGRPFVRAKVALSLDGRPALRAHARASITGVSGAEVTRRLRSRADAVLVGASTVAIDDPALTARHPDGTLLERQPLRIVLARHSAPAATRRVFADGAARTVLLAPSELPVPVGLPDAVEVARYAAEDGIRGALESIAALGIVELLVEPGPRLMTSLWRDSLIDDLVTVHAGGMAGASAPVLYRGEADVDSRDEHALAHRARPHEAGLVGDTCVIRWKPVQATPASTAVGTSDHEYPSSLTPRR